MPSALVPNTLHRDVWLGYERYHESRNIISENYSVPKLSGQVLHVAHGGYRWNFHQATFERTQLFDGVPNNIKNIINEAMEYEPSEDIIPNMNEHSFAVT